MPKRQRAVLAASPVAERQTLFESMLGAVEDECDSSKPCKQQSKLVNSRFG
jgi:hypothetical protein